MEQLNLRALKLSFRPSCWIISSRIGFNFLRMKFIKLKELYFTVVCDLPKCFVEYWLVNRIGMHAVNYKVMKAWWSSLVDTITYWFFLLLFVILSWSFSELSWLELSADVWVLVLNCVINSWVSGSFSLFANLFIYLPVSNLVINPNN